METMEQLEEFWAKTEDEEFLKFARVQNKRHRRIDINGMILLDELIGEDVPHSIIGGAAHDEIFLDGGLEELLPKLTEDVVTDLIRCGVRIQDGGFQMYA